MSSNPLWGRWKESLEKLREEWRQRGGIHSPDDFNNRLQEAKDEGQRDDLRRSYRRAWKDRQILLDQRKQEDWADVREKLRFLIFRTALAFMIMGVVLLTAFLAKRWELPLPMMRSLPIPSDQQG